jgi:hypothetical protein
MFLYYFSYTLYGFYSLALFLVLYLVLGMFTYFLLNFEMPALNWNPFHHYTPSVEQPRTLFFPSFSLSWYHDLPQMWTMFYPLFGRSGFTQAQMSLVDRNHILLNTTLQTAVQSRFGGMQGLNPLVELGQQQQQQAQPQQQQQQPPAAGGEVNQNLYNVHDNPGPVLDNLISPLPRSINNSAAQPLNSSNSNALMLDMPNDVDPIGTTSNNIRLNWSPQDEENNYRRLNNP